ncbi:hypothetical protein KFL_003210100 [Klebsormidium nitens]|uniref:Uncharacterized protein n=1 Tax=Klebsormidium nitens TaxID=105231 RepID=A0A1Y1I7J0_KLENI|nr:hypothetical protein KFL_003210100 [Klebsormidium nitens]|eukprot:GAQ86934.1 hypothetical protein KFL_003210100 [Klebsormidium nitens]
MGYQSAPSANPAPNPGYNYRGEGSYPQHIQPTSPQFGASQGSTYFGANRQPYQQNYQQTFQPREHQVPDYQSPHAWNGPSQPSSPSYLQSQPSVSPYLHSQPSIAAPDYSHPFAVNLNPLFGNGHSAGVMQTPASPRLNPLYASPDQQTLVTPGQFFLNQSQTPFLTQSQNLGRQQTLPPALTRPSTGVLPSYLGSRTGLVRNPRGNQMGIELGRVGSADMAKSTVMMQLLAAHHESLGQRDAVSARHEELERRHYELMKAQARLEVEREGGGSPRRNRGGSGKSRNRKDLGVEKRCLVSTRLCVRLSVLEQRLATALPGPPQSSSHPSSSRQEPATIHHRPQQSNESPNYTTPKLPLTDSPKPISDTRLSQPHEPRTLPLDRSPPHEGGPENLRTEPLENGAGVSSHGNGANEDPAPREILGGLVIAPGGCREAQDEGYAALYYVYMAFLLGLAAYCMVFAGALKGADSGHPGAWYREAGYMLASAAGEALLLVAFLLALARAFHGAVVMVVVIVPSLLSALGAGVLLSRQMWVPGGLMCGVLLATLLGIFLARKGLSFAGATSGVAFDAMRERWGTVIFCIFTAILQGVATLCLLIEVVICVRGLGWAATIPYIMGYLWTLSVAANNVHFVVGGSVAAWCSAEPLVSLAQPTRDRERDAAGRVAPGSPQQSRRFRDPAGSGQTQSGLAVVIGANVGAKPEGEAPRVQGWVEAKGLEVSAARPRRKVAGTPSFVKWAITKSAGSVCGGVIVDVSVWLVDWAVYILGFLCCCCTFCCGDSSAFHMRDWAKERSNRFGLVRCGMRGTTYVQSSKDAWRFVKASASHAMADGDVMHHVVFLGSLFGALLPGCLTALWARSNHGGDNELVIFAFIAGFLLGYAIVQPLFHALSSAAAAILLCAMEDPLQLERNRNPLCAELKAAWSKTWGRTPWDDLILSTRVAAASRESGAIANPWAVTEIWGAEHVAQGEGVHVAPREGSDDGSPHPGSRPGMVRDNQKLVVYEPAIFPAHPPAYPEPPESFRVSQSQLGSGSFTGQPGKHSEDSTKHDQGQVEEPSFSKAAHSPSKQEVESRGPTNGSNPIRPDAANQNGPGQNSSPAEGTVAYGSGRPKGSGSGEDILARTIGKIKGVGFEEEDIKWVKGGMDNGGQLPTENLTGMPEQQVGKAPERHVSGAESLMSRTSAKEGEEKGSTPQKAEAYGSAERNGTRGPVPSGTAAASVPSGARATEKSEPQEAKVKGTTGGTVQGPQSVSSFGASVPSGASGTEKLESRRAEAKGTTRGTVQGPQSGENSGASIPSGASATEKLETRGAEAKAATGGTVRGPQTDRTAVGSVPSGASAAERSGPRGAEAKGTTRETVQGPQFVGTSGASATEMSGTPGAEAKGATAGNVRGPQTDRTAGGSVPSGGSTTEKSETRGAEAKGATAGSVRGPNSDSKLPLVIDGNVRGTAGTGGQSGTEPSRIARSGPERGEKTGKGVSSVMDAEGSRTAQKGGTAAVREVDSRSGSGAQTGFQTGSGTTSSGGTSESKGNQGEGPSSVSGKEGAKSAGNVKAGSRENEPERNSGKESGSGKSGVAEAAPVARAGTGGSSFKVKDALKDESAREDKGNGGGVDQSRKPGSGSADTVPSAGMNQPILGTGPKSAENGKAGLPGVQPTVTEALKEGSISKKIDDSNPNGKPSLQKGSSKVEESPRKNLPDVSKVEKVTGLGKEDEVPRGKLAGQKDEVTPQGTRVKLADLQPVRPKGVPLEGGSVQGALQPEKDAAPLKAGPKDDVPRNNAK